MNQSRTSRFAVLTIVSSAIVVCGLVAWKSTRRYQSPPAPESVLVRQAPLFQLHDQAMNALRIQRYIGRHKLLVAFLDATNGVDRSDLALSLRQHWKAMERTGGIVLGITAARPAENREAIDRSGEWPFVLLSDLNDFEVHRQWGAFDDQAGRPREAVVVVDRSGLIRFAHFGPDGLGTPEAWTAELRSVR